MEFAPLSNSLAQILTLGGPVVGLLLVMSVVTLSVTIYKVWQFRAAGVGRHVILRRALQQWDGGRLDDARADVATSRSYLAPLIARAMAAAPGREVSDRLDAEAGLAFARLEGGFRLLDNISQLAPLLGLFGTVLGMIDAFQSLQAAGNTVDPSILAGGIWVALLTTAVGLSVAMPTALILAWFESRMDRERVFADGALRTVLAPLNGTGDRKPGQLRSGPVHAV